MRKVQLNKEDIIKKIKDIIQEKKELLQCLNGENESEILFYIKNFHIDDFKIITHVSKKYNGTDQKVQKILIETKQALISVLEDNIKDLEDNITDLEKSLIMFN